MIPWKYKLKYHNIFTGTTKLPQTACLFNVHTETTTPQWPHDFMWRNINSSCSTIAVQVLLISDKPSMFYLIAFNPSFFARCISDDSVCTFSSQIHVTISVKSVYIFDNYIYFSVLCYSVNFLYLNYISLFFTCF